VEPGETNEAAAVRETSEEVGLTVRATELLGDRVHPNTGRTMVYVACEVVDGEAYVADDEELAEVAWCTKGLLTEYVPYPLFEPVQRHLDGALKD
jgi:8-oxo-dGTP diphosphatase